MIIIYLLLVLCLASCSKPVNELDAMSRDVIKHKEGVDIRITPIPQESKK